MRPFIIFVAIIGLFWALASGISSFRNGSFYDNNNESKLGVYCIIVGVFGMVIVAIETFGIFALFSRRAAFVRIYFWLSILAAATIAAAYIIQAVIHSRFKTDIINLCINVNAGDHVFFTGFFGPVDGGVVTPSEAIEWCNQEFNHFSVSIIVALLVVTGLALIFAGFVYVHWRQLSNKTSPATFPMGAYIPPNNQTYSPYHPTQAYNNERSNETLHVPEDAFDKLDKPPNYEGEGLVDHKLKDYDLKYSSNVRE